MSAKSQRKKASRLGKNVWINSQFQGRFVLFCMLPFGLQTIACLFLNEPMQMLISFFVILCLFLPLAVIFSHRICGPIYRMDLQMRQDAASHTLSMVRFRKNDFFVELAGSYNVLVTAINESRSIE